MKRKTIYLFNTIEVQDENSGLIEKTVTNKRKALGIVSQVGANAFWNATSNQIELSYQIEIQSDLFQMQKYAAFRNFGSLEIYEIFNTGKGSRPNLITLNVRKTSEEIEGGIEDVWF